MLTTAEVRWFWRGHCPRQLHEWFFQTGNPPGGGRSRTDRYIPQIDQPEISLKTDAVYGYLSVVLAIVQHWKILGHSRAWSLHALTAANSRVAIRTRDPFAIVIYCTSDPRIVDAKTRSKWSKALQFAARNKPAGQPVGTFMKSHGGINECSIS